VALGRSPLEMASSTLRLQSQLLRELEQEAAIGVAQIGAIRDRPPAANGQRPPRSGSLDLQPAVPPEPGADAVLDTTFHRPSLHCRQSKRRLTEPGCQVSSPAAELKRLSRSPKVSTSSLAHPKLCG